MFTLPCLKKIMDPKKLYLLAKQKAQRWLAPPYDQQTQTQVQALLNQNSPKKLIDAFAFDLHFGTGGMRALMGIGTGCINRYTVAKVAQGLADYLCTESVPRVVLAFDSRRGAFELALEMALVFAANRIQAMVFSTLRPTPILSFAVPQPPGSLGSDDHRKPQSERLSGPQGVQCSWGAGGGP